MKALELKSGLIFEITNFDYQNKVVTLGGCRYRYFHEVVFIGACIGIGYG